MAFKTADAGRGKSRALETVGTLCYLPILCGGGSTAAATLRLIDQYGGTLVADEFDQRDTELAAELTKIINQGFQKNRPLVRCDGENNQPKPFRCFGPKLFALRKGFGDDATETRIIQIKMQQRTRAEIPINLPRAEFDAGALRLRNRLLWWRFKHAGTFTVNPEHHDPGLEDRLNQIGGPLLAIAGTEEGRQRIIRALGQQQEEVAAGRADSFAGAVLDAILAIAGVGDMVRPADVAKEFNRRRAESEGIEIDRLRKPVTRERVSQCIRSVFEFPRAGRDRAGVKYILDEGRMEEVRRRYGGRATEPTQPTHLHPAPQPTPQNPHLWPENSESVGGVGCTGVSGDGVGQPAQSARKLNNLPAVDTSGTIPHGYSCDGWVKVLTGRLDLTDDPDQRTQFEAAIKACREGGAA